MADHQHYCILEVMLILERNPGKRRTYVGSWLATAAAVRVSFNTEPEPIPTMQRASNLAA